MNTESSFCKLNNNIRLYSCNFIDIKPAMKAFFSRIDGIYIEIQPAFTSIQVE